MYSAHEEAFIINLRLIYSLISFFIYFCSILGEAGDADKASASHPTAFQETSQVALSKAAVNQATFQANPVQSYISNQPYFNRFTGKSVMTQSMNRPMSTFSSLTSSRANAVDRYTMFPAMSAWNLIGENRHNFIAKAQKGKPVPVSMSGAIPLSTEENIPIIKLYKSGKLVIYRSKSYLLHNHFPFANANVPCRNNMEGASSSSYSKPFTQNAILPNPLPYLHGENTNRVLPYPVEAGSLTNKLTSVSQTTTLASNIGLYDNQNKITSPSPFVNSYLKDSLFWIPNDAITHSFHNIETGQAKDKVVTEGELKEKGLLNDIVARSHTPQT